jgi:hypothetical protein
VAITNSLLLKSHRNEVFLAIKERQLNPLEFEWHEVASDQSDDTKVSLLVHRPTTLYFLFDVLERLPHCTYSPGTDRTVAVEYPGDWEGQFNHCKKWLDNLKREIDEPDLWATVTEEKQLVASASADIENAPFSAGEMQRISIAITEMRTYVVQTGNPTEQQLQFISARLAYLEDASKRLGRKDWLTLAVGVITNIVVGVALAPDAARELFRMAGRLLGWIAPAVPLLH